MHKRLPDPDAVWTDDDARRVLAAWRQGAEPLAVFARRHGFGPNRLYWWRKRLGDQGMTQLELVPAQVTHPAEVAVIVRIANSVSIEIPNASPKLIADLIEELARSRS